MPINLKAQAYRIDALHSSAVHISYKEDWLHRLLGLPFDSQLEKDARLFLYSLVALNTYQNPLQYRNNSTLINTLHHEIKWAFSFLDDSPISNPVITESFKPTNMYNLLSILNHALTGHPRNPTGSFHYLPSVPSLLYKGDIAYYQSKAYSHAKGQLGGRYGVRNVTYLYEIEKSTPTFIILSYLPCRDFYIDAKHRDAYQRQALESNAITSQWLVHAIDNSSAGGLASPAYHEASMPILWLPTNHPKFTQDEVYLNSPNLERIVPIRIDLRGLSIPSLETLINTPTVAQTEARRALVDSIGFVYNDILNNPLKVRDYFQTKRNEYKR